MSESEFDEEISLGDEEFVDEYDKYDTQIPSFQPSRGRGEKSGQKQFYLDLSGKYDCDVLKCLPKY